MRHPIEMHTTSATDFDMRESRLPWTEENSRGVHHAERAEWSPAADAFAVAADTIATNETAEPASHEAMALVLGNLANASFRAGNVEEGIRHAQRACALRVALVGEDAITVARARSDLAVMLCAVDRAPEGMALMERAIAAIEHFAGDEDAHLIPVLENAARIAMAMAQPATAEPFLLRMHSLLAAHDLPVDRAEALLARVAESRAPTPRAVAAQPELEQGRTEQPVVERDSAEQTARAHEVERQRVDLGAGLELEPVADADDQPLRDAVAVTDVLLRTTPTGSPIIRRDDGADDSWNSAGNAPSYGALEEMRSGAQAPTSEPVADDSEVVETFALELERDLHATLPSSALGFTVEYGFTGYEEQSTPRMESNLGAELELAEELAELPAPAPSPSSVHQEPEPAIEIFEPVAMPAAPAPLELHAGAESAPFLRPVSPRSSPRSVAVVMPSPSAGVAALRTDGADSHGTDDDSSATGNTLVLPDDSTRERRPFGAALRAGRATAPKSSHGVMIAAIVTVAVGGAAAWVYLHGGF